MASATQNKFAMLVVTIGVGDIPAFERSMHELEV